MTELYDIKFDSKQPKMNRWGHLFVDLIIGKVGVINRGDKKEFVSEATLFDSKSLETLKASPVPQYHPRENGVRVLLDSKNTSKHNRGLIIGEPYKLEEDGEIFLVAPAVIQDKKAVDNIFDGSIKEVSPGYTAKEIDRPGKWKAESYHVEQEDRFYNHVALVPTGSGRGGASVKVKMDSQDENEYIYFDYLDEKVKTDSKNILKGNDNKKKVVKMKTTINGKVYDLTIPEESENLLQLKFDSEEKELNDLKTENKDLKEKFDSFRAEAKTEVDNLKAEVKKLKDVDHVAVARNRMKLEDEVKPILGTEYKFDGKTDMEIKKDAVLKLAPDENLTGDNGSDGYINGRYKGLVATQKYDSSDANFDRSQASVGSGYKPNLTGGIVSNTKETAKNIIANLV